MSEAEPSIERSRGRRRWPYVAVAACSLALMLGLYGVYRVLPHGVETELVGSWEVTGGSQPIDYEATHLETGAASRFLVQRPGDGGRFIQFNNDGTWMMIAVVDRGNVPFWGWWDALPPVYVPA